MYFQQLAKRSDSNIVCAGSNFDGEICAYPCL